MNLTWLDDFLALAETGNFSRAADTRSSSQPAFSRRIRNLEDWLGTALFDRSTQPATLTDTGRWFADVARDLLARVARVPGEAKQMAEARTCMLRIASTHSLSFTFLPRWLSRFQAGNTLGSVQLMSDVLQRCEELLMQSKVQFLLCHAHAQAPSPLDAEAYSSAGVGHDVLVPVSRPDAHGQPVHCLDGAGDSVLPVLHYTEESGLGRIARAVVAPRLDQRATSSVFTAHLASVIRTVALDGLGIAWLPKSLVQDDLNLGKLVLAGPGDWHVPLEIRLYREKGGLGSTAEAFWRSTASI